MLAMLEQLERLIRFLQASSYVKRNILYIVNFPYGPNYNLTDGLQEDKHGRDNANKHARYSRVQTRPAVM